MFKFPIPTKTIVVAKFLLSTLMITTYIGWWIPKEASGQEESRQQITASTMTQSSQELEEIAQRTYDLVNQYRAALDLAPLEFNSVISEHAIIHSENMAQQKVKFGHENFDNRVAALKSDLPYRSAGENVAYNMGYSDPAAKAVLGWIDSDGHRRNMLGNFNLTGIGVVKNNNDEYYFTQIFIREK